MNYQLLPVSESDREPLAELRAAAMKDSLGALGRFEPESARGRTYDHFRPQETQKILVDGQLAGFYVLLDEGHYLLLNHLYIRPEWQGRGLGGRVVDALLSEARRRGINVQLTVLKGSRANRFYRAHGFRQIGRDGEDIFYEYRAKYRS